MFISFFMSGYDLLIMFLTKIILVIVIMIKMENLYIDNKRVKSVENIVIPYKQDVFFH